MSINYGKNLKSFYLAFMEYPELILVGNKFGHNNLYYQHDKLDLKLFKSHILFIENMKVNPLKDTTVYKEAHAAQLNSYLNSWIERLISLECLSEFKTNVYKTIDNHTEMIDATSYSLNAKGIEIAFKIQEHDDNERRFNFQKETTKAQVDISVVQKNISKSQNEVSQALKINSDKSLVTSVVALC